MERKVLLKITDSEGVGRIEFGCDGIKDVFLLGLMLYVLFEEHSDVRRAVDFNTSMFDASPSIKQKLQDYTLHEDDILNLFNIKQNGNTEHTDD